MATLPPRKNPTPTKISKQHLSPLQTLLQMGFPKHRAEKALAATGNRDVQLASDWLLTHVNDPSLDECSPREYILYACPTGRFLEQIHNFWAKSKELCGWNGAHNFTPHITLVSFFKAPDECAPQLSRALKQVVEQTAVNLDRPLKLEQYTSHNFMGFFVVEEDANYLNRLALQYVKEVSNSIISDTYEQLDALVACFPWCGGVTSGARCIPRSSRSISLEPHVKSLHLTLAYQFPEAQYGTLKSLVDNLDPSCASAWELRLYSRDARLATKQVHKILYPHTPREPDELELMIGDYIYLSSDALQNTQDGWVEGISWLTGMSGFLPENYTVRTSESDAWTMHRTVQLCKAILAPEEGDAANGKMPDPQDNISESTAPIEDVSMTKEDSVPDFYGAEMAKTFQQMINSTGNASILSEAVDKSAKSVTPEVSGRGRRIFVMRHGERVDFTFGSWIPYCFDEFGNYTRKDLNMPKTLPRRKNVILGWQKDSPLTNVGVYQANLIGEGLREAGVNFSHVYSSPSFRCVQTATGVLTGMNIKDTMPINLEPGFFEWLAWHAHSGENVVEWCSKQELTDTGFNIAMDYQPCIPVDQLHNHYSESLEQFYDRNNTITREIIKKTTGDILIVGHAITLDACTRDLCAKPPRQSSELNKLMQKVTYCSLVAAEQVGENEWRIGEPPCYPVTHTNNQRFDWKILSG
ncbi:ecdysteroid-phosphate phosphatase isoform X1 [Lutzomyia longipalpis]|uniref:ecdysteroid-phosphate phosphatase isoform X1 n=1 Tax=Lutzomyia longipalpis TaxID=7200 RepID=UPI0024839A18|nr:ecdysteroid-phosphate phosphatase isoform X1 [Lutzomyia longipalpis]